MVAHKKASDRQSPVSGEPDAQYAATQVGASWGGRTLLHTRFFAPKANIFLAQRMGVSTKAYATIRVILCRAGEMAV